MQNKEKNILKLEQGKYLSKTDLNIILKVIHYDNGKYFVSYGV